MNNIFEWANRHNCSAEALTDLLDVLDPSRNVSATPSNETSEADVQANIRLAAAKVGAAAWRNNNGAAMAVNSDGSTRQIRFGVGNDSAKLNDAWASSDLIGITPVQDPISFRIYGVFTATECKSPGWTLKNTKREVAQSAFHTTVRSMGGIAMFAQSTADFKKNLGVK